MRGDCYLLGLDFFVEGFVLEAEVLHAFVVGSEEDVPEPAVDGGGLNVVFYKGLDDEDFGMKEFFKGGAC